MEEVKDTLWKWAIQAGALAGLGISVWAVWMCSIEMKAEPERDATMLIAGTVLLGPILGLACLRMLYLRRWAGGLVCVLACWSLYEAATSHWAGHWNWLAAFVLIALMLGYALLFRPRVWHPGW